MKRGKCELIYGIFVKGELVSELTHELSSFKNWNSTAHIFDKGDKSVRLIGEVMNSKDRVIHL